MNEEIYRSVELWKLPYVVRRKWKTGSRSAGKKASGALLQMLRILVWVASVVIKVATSVGTVSEGVYNAPFWLLVKALFAVEAIEITTKVELYIYFFNTLNDS